MIRKINTDIIKEIIYKDDELVKYVKLQLDKFNNMNDKYLVTNLYTYLKNFNDEICNKLKDCVIGYKTIPSKEKDWEKIITDPLLRRWLTMDKQLIRVVSNTPITIIYKDNSSITPNIEPTTFIFEECIKDGFLTFEELC